MTAIEQTQEKLTEMKLEDAEKSAATAQPVTTMPFVGGAMDDDDSSDDEPAVDIDEFDEPEDPVSCPYNLNNIINTFLIWYAWADHALICSGHYEEASNGQAGYRGGRDRSTQHENV